MRHITLACLGVFLLAGCATSAPRNTLDEQVEGAVQDVNDDIEEGKKERDAHIELWKSKQEIEQQIVVYTEQLECLRKEVTELRNTVERRKALYQAAQAKKAQLQQDIEALRVDMRVFEQKHDNAITEKRQQLRKLQQQAKALLEIVDAF